MTKEYDYKGNLIHCKDSKGYESWRKYDSNNNLIHYKNSNGFESRRTYDSNGNLIHYEDSNGEEFWYDKEGNEIENPMNCEEMVCVICKEQTLTPQNYEGIIVCDDCVTRENLIELKNRLNSAYERIDRLLSDSLGEELEKSENVR